MRQIEPQKVTLDGKRVHRRARREAPVRRRAGASCARATSPAPRARFDALLQRWPGSGYARVGAVLARQCAVRQARATRRRSRRSARWSARARQPEGARGAARDRQLPGRAEGHARPRARRSTSWSRPIRSPRPRRPGASALASLRSSGRAAARGRRVPRLAFKIRCMQEIDLGALATQVLWAAFALSVVFGAIAQRTHFCTMGAVSDIVNMGDWTRMRMWVLAMGVAIDRLQRDGRGGLDRRRQEPLRRPAADLAVGAGRRRACSASAWCWPRAAAARRWCASAAAT